MRDPSGALPTAVAIAAITDSRLPAQPIRPTSMILPSRLLAPKVALPIARRSTQNRSAAARMASFSSDQPSRLKSSTPDASPRSLRCFVKCFAALPSEVRNHELYLTGGVPRGHRLQTATLPGSGTQTSFFLTSHLFAPVGQRCDAYRSGAARAVPCSRSLRNL